MEYQNKILLLHRQVLLHRQDNKTQGNTWGIPGGKLGKGETPINEHKAFIWVTPQDALKMDLMLDEDPCIRLVYT